MVVERPTYFLALEIFRTRGLRVVAACSDRDGLDVAALARDVDAGRFGPGQVRRSNAERRLLVCVAPHDTAVSLSPTPDHAECELSKVEWSMFVRVVHTTRPSPSPVSRERQERGSLAHFR